MNRKTLTQLLLAIVLAGSAAAYAVDRPIQVGMEDGTSVVQFKIGDSQCVLVNDQVRCTRVGK